MAVFLNLNVRELVFKSKQLKIDTSKVHGNT